MKAKAARVRGRRVRRRSSFEVKEWAEEDEEGGVERSKA
jgi:hypothetical protein